MSVGYIKGLQGDHPKYLLSAATMKHFLANSNEDGRTSSSSDFDERNLRKYYLVPFQMGIQEGNAQSFMASYNAVNKIPDTVSPFIRDIVEKEWKFDGMVCTDAGSLPNLTRQFHSCGPRPIPCGARERLRSAWISRTQGSAPAIFAY
jgi:beta-glucosidase